MWESEANEDFIKREQDNPNATFYPQGELKITSGWEELLAENCKLVYRFDIYAEKPLGRYWVDVDAVTGEVFNKISRIHDSDVPGSGLSLYNGTVNMTVDQVSASSFRLQGNTTRGAAIRTFDMNNGTNYNAATNFTASNANGPWDEGGVSGHFGAEVTYDYYLNEHGRNSLNNAGFALLSYVHYGTNYNNAFWDGSRMTYGDGNGTTFTPLISLDVVAHELTHGVTEFSADLVYQKEPGALNESFSDIFGNLVEFEIEGLPGVGTGNWRVGEDITTSGLGIRNMANPNDFGDPDTYGGTYWVNVVGCIPNPNTNDNCGVHTNSGVQNFWFYLLVEGGSGTNDNGDPYNVTGIGAADAAAIAYRNLTVYLDSGSEYIDARNGSIDAATDLFGDPSQQLQSVKDAWDAVGVYGPPDPPEIDVFPASLSCIVPPDGNDAAVLTISNTAAAGAQNLIWSIAEQEVVLALDSGRRLPVQMQELPALPKADFGAQELSLSSSDVTGNFEDLFTAQYPTPGHSSAEAGPVVPLALESAVSLVLDDGNRENAIGLTTGGQFIWLNRFTPNPADFPFTLQEIRILFPNGSGISVGQLVDIYIYEDTDGDGNPGTGETFLAAYNNAAVQAVDDVTFSVYPISPLVLNGPNDVLIAVVNRTAGIAAGTFVAAIDQTASAGRSWVGTYSSGNPGNPPTLPATGLWGIIDSFGLPGNWMIRGYGITGTGCPWLSENPTSGTIIPTGNQQITVSVDATGLSPGTYNCDLVISSNDPDENPVTVPVELIVTGGLVVDAKVFLEGPYNAGSMDTYLRDNALLPTSQPFSGPPWNYGETESVGSIPNGVVDWVLLELRSSAAGDAVASRAAFVTSDGSIVDLDGSSPVDFLYPPGNYYLVIRHRNHLDIMSIDPVALSQSSALYDFTTPDGQAYGTDPMKDLGGGVFGMFAGDGDANGSVTAADRADVWRTQNGTDWDYAKFADFNLDGY